MAPDHNPIIEFKGVDFSYGGEALLFRGLSLKIQAGGFYLIEGPSGSGKSTFLRLVNRLEEPVGGEIFFEGRPLASYHPPLLRRSILYIQQIPTVIEASVRDNLLLPFTFRHNRDLGRPGDDRLKSLLNEFKLDGIRLEDSATNLSVGQLQRVCFIRGLLLSPEALLLDEPTSALDPESGKVVFTAVEKMSARGLTVMMVTHRRFEPLSANPRLFIVREGGIKEEPWERK